MSDYKVIYNGLTEQEVKHSAKWIMQFPSLPENTAPQMVPYLGRIEVLAVLADLEGENVGFNHAAAKYLMPYARIHDRSLSVGLRLPAVKVVIDMVKAYRLSPYYGDELLKQAKLTVYHEKKARAKVFNEFLANLRYIRPSAMMRLLEVFNHHQLAKIVLERMLEDPEMLEDGTKDKNNLETQAKLSGFLDLYFNDWHV